MPGSTVDEKISPGRNFQPITFADDAEFTITNEDGTTHYCRGFHANADGDMWIVGADGRSALRKVVCKEGNYYPYSVRKFMATDTSAALKAAQGSFAVR